MDRISRQYSTQPMDCDGERNSVAGVEGIENRPGHRAHQSFLIGCRKLVGLAFLISSRTGAAM
jgi:hypothetical protein